MYAYIHTKSEREYVYTHTYIYIYIYRYIFAGPSALGVVRSQTSILYLNPLRGFNPSPYPSPGRSWG